MPDPVISMLVEIRALTIFDKIGSPYAGHAKSDIARVREKMSGEDFEEVVREFE